MLPSGDDEASWLIVGGAGYIGSHIVHELSKLGHKVVVVDNLQTGIRQSIPASTEFVYADASDDVQLQRIIEAHSVKIIVHLAALKQARESVRRPLYYWNSNLRPVLGLMQAVQNSPVEAFVLSSSCSVYGPQSGVDSGAEIDPRSPYAQTKFVSEMVVESVLRGTGVNWAALRYFNVIGNAEFRYAPDRSPVCLLPAAARAICSGNRPVIFGNDFQTPDGTALRDYIDVRDVASAHIAVALDLLSGSRSITQGLRLNVGTGIPTSVLEILDLLSQETGWKEGYEISQRVDGDPESVWASPSPELKEKGWNPRYSVADSIQSHLMHPDTR